jgi:quercetin dioxygenase-like cupin family protein
VQRKEEHVQVVDLNRTETLSLRGGLEVAFPISSATGSAASAVVWIELETGGAVPEHCDSAEELLYVVSGEVEASVGDESGALRAGELAVVPPMAPHSLRNVGDEEARVLGFFAGCTVVSTFTDGFGPEDEQLFVIGAPRFLAAQLEEAATLRA